MKKYWKQITLGLTVVLLAVAGYLVYAFEFKEYETADKEVDKVTEEKIEVDLPDDSKIVVDEEGNVTEEKDEDEDKEEKEDKDAKEDAADATASTKAPSASSNNNGAVQTAAASNTSKTAGATSGNSSNGNSDSSNGKATNNNGSNSGNNYNGGNKGNNGSGRVTVVQIKSKYETALTNLEDTANARIDGLVNVAKKEYQADPPPNYAVYYRKYTNAASKLENQMDAAFYGVIGVMKRDLKAHGLAESHVKSVINEYENTKKQRRNALMKKAAGLK